MKPSARRSDQVPATVAARVGARVLGVVFLVTAVFVPLADAATWVLDPGGTGDFPTIQAAVTAAAAGDVVALMDGTYRGDGNHNIDFGGKALTVRSQSGNPAACVIDCEATTMSPARRGFIFQWREERDSIVEGLTIRNGAGDLGGGIFSYRSSPSIINCRIVDCIADQGGGLNVDLGSPLIDGCVITTNSASSFAGGGLFLAECSPTIRNTTIAMNSSGVDQGGNREGAGIAVFFASFATIENCIIANNILGEGIFCDPGSSADISCSNVFGNEAGDWVGSIADQAEMSGNLSADPLFCGPTGGLFGLASGSPCAPPASGCGLIGALGVECIVVHVQSLSWGQLKSLYR